MPDSASQQPPAMDPPRRAEGTRKPEPLGDQALRLIENIAAVSIGVAVLVMLGVLFVAFSAFLVSPDRAWPKFIAGSMLTFLERLTASWKALLLLLVPLAYRPTRQFLEEAHTFFGAKRTPRQAGRKRRKP